MNKFGKLGSGCSLAVVAALGVMAPGIAHAGGFYLQEQSTKGMGRAFSGEVADQGAESLWWNPASIGGTQGVIGYLGATAIIPRGDVVDDGTLIVRPGGTPASVGGNAKAHNPINNGVVPSGAIAFALSPQVAFGVAISAPYNFTTDYDADSWARYTSDKTEVRTVDIQPTIAFMPTPELSVGVGLNIEYADAVLSNYLPNYSALQPDGHQKLEGNGWDIGWSAGVQYRSGPVSLGVAYKSSINHKLKGTVTTSGLLTPLDSQNGSIDTHASFRTPWMLSFGGRYAVSDKATLNAQVSRIGWSKFDTISLGAPLNTEIPENYRNTWSYAVGLDYKLTPQLTVRTGVQYDLTPTRDGFRDTRVPDSNRWNFSAGASYALSPSFTIDAAASYLTLKDATIDRTTAAYAGTPVQTPILVNGRTDNASVIMLSLGGRFAF